MATWASSAPCATGATAALLAAAVLLVVGLLAPWGHAKFNIGAVVSGTGDFTLWEATVAPTIEIVDIGLPPTRFSIADSMCGGDGAPLAEVENVCNKFGAMQACTAAALATAVLAAGFAVSRRVLGPCCPLMLVRTVFPAGAALLALTSSACAFFALAAAASLSQLADNRYFRAEGRPGAGSVGVAVAAVCCLAAGIAALVGLARDKARGRELREAGEKGNLQV